MARMYGLRMGTGSGRGPVRRVWLIVAACALVVLVLPAAASAATITVDINTDANAADPANCELREAITAANTNAATDGCAAAAWAPTRSTSLLPCSPLRSW